MPRVDEQAVELVFQDRPDRFPVDAGRLHRHLRHPIGLQPVAQRQQPAHGGREFCHLLRSLTAPAGNTHTRRHLRLVHIQPGSTLDDRLHDLLLTNDEHWSSPVGPQKQTSLIGVPYGNSPAYRGGSSAMRTAGSRAP
jgi:hypothetical protein